MDRRHEAINARDADLLAAVSAPDIEWRDPEGVPGAGVHHGVDEVIARFREFDESMEELRFAPGDLVERGDRVLVITHASGRGRESGVPVELEFFAVYRIREGRIASMNGYFDRGEAERALQG